MLLSSLDVLVVDCQTTGATPAHGVVLELGWGVARADGAGVRGLSSHWITLPERHFVPAQVRRLTGFDPASAGDTLAPAEAWQRLRGAVQAAPLVPTAIHFAQFELAFLRDWAARFEPGAAFPLDVICVHAIARRLYPDLPRRSIRALAGYLGHSLELARRCQGHVAATAFIWSKLVPALADRGVRRWSELTEWLAAPAPPRARRRQYPLPRATYRALPDEPGVYRFVRSNGDVLYVGKAASLRKRVASHFTAGAGTSERALEMLTQVHDIRATPTATALEAALLENEEIKAIDPPYNIQLLDGDRSTWFFDRRLDDVQALPDARHRQGPLPSTHSVRALRALRALLEGEAPSLELRARAVGAPARWAPDEAVFQAGYARFVERAGLCSTARAELEGALRIVARRLLAVSAESAQEGNTAEAVESGRPGSWDADRVLRHLERGLAHAHQLLHRARWLCLLHDCDVLFREAASPRSRWLSIRAGRLAQARDGTLEAPLAAPPPYRPLEARQSSFDRGQYDRLRTLASELKRVLRDGGEVQIRLGKSHWLGGEPLARGLCWI